MSTHSNTQMKHGGIHSHVCFLLRDVLPDQRLCPELSRMSAYQERGKVQDKVINLSHTEVAQHLSNKLLIPSFCNFFLFSQNSTKAS